MLKVDAVPAYLDLLDVFDLAHGAKDGNLQVEAGQLFPPQRREAGVIEGRGYGHVLHRGQKGLRGIEVADAPPQAAIKVQVTNTPLGRERAGEASMGKAAVSPLRWALMLSRATRNSIA